MPIELHNVRMQQPFIAGTGTAEGLAALGVAAMTLLGRARQRHLEGQVRFVPAVGDAVLMEDRIALHLVATGNVRGVTITNDAADRTVDIDIYYRWLKRWGQEPAGVYLDMGDQGVIWVQPRDNGEFVQWLAHLSYDKTWKPPTPLELTAEVPVARWCQQDPRYTFGMPEQWQDPPSPQAFAQFAADYTAPLALRVFVGRVDGAWEAQLLVIEICGVDAREAFTEPQVMATEFVVAHDVHLVGPMYATNLGGQPAALFRGTISTSTGIVDVTYLHVIRNNTPFMIWYRVGGTVGDGSHERWLPHVHTMLSTWHWYI